MTDVHVVVPEGIDDPARPSGGNAYDRRGLPGARRARLAGARARRARRLAAARRRGAHAASRAPSQRIPDGAVVLLDGLIASAGPEALVPQARRLRQIVLVRMKPSAVVMAAVASGFFQYPFMMLAPLTQSSPRSRTCGT